MAARRRRLTCFRVRRRESKVAARGVRGVSLARVRCCSLGEKKHKKTNFAKGRHTLFSRCRLHGPSWRSSPRKMPTRARRSTPMRESACPVDPLLLAHNLKTALPPIHNFLGVGGGDSRGKGERGCFVRRGFDHVEHVSRTPGLSPQRGGGFVRARIRLRFTRHEQGTETGVPHRTAEFLARLFFACFHHHFSLSLLSGSNPSRTLY